MVDFLKDKFHFLKALMAVLYYKFPARKLIVIGVTGTDGKTTTSTLIYHILKSSGEKTALVSTIAAYVGNRKIDTGLHVTSPGPWFLQKFMKDIANRNYKYLVLEATSHGLHQHRLLGTNISIAVLTNITHEHTDYHGSYFNYLKTKAKLFRKTRMAILNREDASFGKIKRTLKSGSVSIPYDRKTLKGQVKKIVKKKFPESHNRLNATAAILVARQLDIKDITIVKAIRIFSGVPGRLEEIKNKKGIKILIDFAHTPNALKNILQTLRKTKKRNKKLIAVFGCAGERDIVKRPMMGEISARLADISVFTAEDPRNESVDGIVDQMMKGIKNRRSKVYIKLERGEAITFAIQELARKGDIVVICGKGCEKSMAYNGVEYSWSDHEATKLALKGKIKQIRRP